MRPRHDPGPCLVCGAAHCSCTDGDTTIAIPQLPQRDQAPAPTLAATAVQAALPAGQFTSATYRGEKKKR